MSLSRRTLFRLGVGQSVGQADRSNSFLTASVGQTGTATQEQAGTIVLGEGNLPLFFLIARLSAALTAGYIRRNKCLPMLDEKKEYFENKRFCDLMTER